MLLLLHLPALTTSWQTVWFGELAAIRPVAFLGLNLSAVLFVLKVCGVRFLEFRVDRHSLLLLTVSLALIHAGVVGANLQSDLLHRDLPLAGGVLFLGGLARVQQGLRALLARVAALRFRQPVVLRFRPQPQPLPIRLFTSPLPVTRAPPR